MRIELDIDELIFVGFNRHVAALERDNGKIVWKWKVPKGSGFPTLLLEDDRLMVCVQGYTYCLDPLTGEQHWQQDFKGFGVGTASMASVHGHSMTPPAAHAIQQQQTDSDNSVHTE